MPTPNFDPNAYLDFDHMNITLFPCNFLIMKLLIIIKINHNKFIILYSNSYKMLIVYWSYNSEEECLSSKHSSVSISIPLILQHLVPSLLQQRYQPLLDIQTLCIQVL